jgi:hypothetical protein
MTLFLQPTAERGFKLLFAKLCAAIESENLELRRCVRLAAIASRRTHISSCVVFVGTVASCWLI